MMNGAILMALCKPYWLNLFAMPEIAISKVNVVITSFGSRMYFTGKWLEYTQEYFVQHLSVCVLLPIAPLVRNIEVLDWNRLESNHYDSEH
jgi:hypothetical protein